MTESHASQREIEQASARGGRAFADGVTLMPVRRT
jgi:hypothetical protein